MIFVCSNAFGQGSPPGKPAAPAGTNVVQLTPALINQWAEEMAAKNPALLAADARTNAAGAGVTAVRTWDDPTARVGGIAAREQMRAEDGDLLYGVEQRLPLFGKPKLARKAALAGLAAQTANATYQFQIQKRELAKTAFRTALADEIIFIGSQDLEWLETFSRTVEQKYAAGQGTVVEVSQVQNDRARRATQLETDRKQLTQERVILNRLLGRDLETPWPSLALPEVAGQIVYNQKLVEFAMKYEPRIKLLEQEIARAEAGVNLARGQRLPDVSVGLEGRNYSGNGSFRQGAMVLSVNLPWVNGGKYRSEIRREEANLRAAQLDLDDYKLTVQQEVHDLVLRIDAARRQILLYQDEIIPRTEKALESARIAWEANRGSFRDVLDARRMLLEGRLMRAREMAEQYQLMSELVLCCGLGDLEALQMLGALPEEK